MFEELARMCLECPSTELSRDGCDSSILCNKCYYFLYPNEMKKKKSLADVNLDDIMHLITFD